MANLLYLVHRMPYPPNKGDKVRSYHLLKYLTARHRVFVGTFIDDPDDRAHVDAVMRDATRARQESLAGRPRVQRADSREAQLSTFQRPIARLHAHRPGRPD
jgi:hypothetical protein